MKRLLLHTLPLLIAQLAAAQSTVPGSISYQGRVTDAAGVLVGDTVPVNRKVTLRVYASAGSPTPLYSEEQVVTISKGLFSVLVGTGLPVGAEPKPPLATVFDDDERFLGVTVDDGGPAADPEITPRQQIVSTAFAFRAKTAEVAGGVNQTSGSSFLNTTSITSLTMSGDVSLGDNQVNFGTGAGAGSLDSSASGLTLTGRGTTAALRSLTFAADGGSTFSGPLFFGNTFRQTLNFQGTQHGIGTQTNTFYQRVGSSGSFAWYQGGIHNSGQGNNGGGTTLATLGTSGLNLPAGNLTLSTGNVTLNSGNVTLGTGRVDLGFRHGPWVQSWTDHQIGSQPYTTYFRSAADQTQGQFTWYLGGSFSDVKGDPGPAGTKVAALDFHGLRLQGAGVESTGLELGYGVAGKENNAGSISYQRFSNGLDIVGAGTGVADRRIKMWADAGTEFTGGITVTGASRVSGFLAVGNTGSPAEAPLHVRGSAFRDNGPFIHYARNGNNQFINNSSGSVSTGILSDSRIVGTEFNATSDARIKNIRGRSNGAADLTTLASLEITDYTMRDTVTHGGRQFKKVIAQQVKQVYPQATSAMPGVVPDIYRPLNAKDGFVTMKEALPVPLKTGETVRILLSKGEVETKVTRVTKDGFAVEEKLDGDVFVYGRRVQDLMTVDYEAIAMLNVSATQEMHRRMEKLVEEKAVLEKLVQELRDKDSRQETRLAAIEKALLQAPSATGPSKSTEAVKTAAVRR